MREGNKVVFDKDGLAHFYAVGTPEVGPTAKIGDGSFDQTVSRSTSEGLALDVGGIAGGALVTGVGKLVRLFGFGAEAANIGRGAENVVESTTSAAKTSTNPVISVATPSNGGGLYASSQRTIISAELGPTYTAGDISSLTGGQNIGVSTAVAKTNIANIFAPNNVTITTQIAKRSAADINAEMVAANN